MQHRIVLFLDDLQFVEEPEVLKILDWLVNYAPRMLQIVIGSREVPRLRLSRLRVRRQLFELGVRQLQFEPEEASRSTSCVARLSCKSDTHRGHQASPVTEEQLTKREVSILKRLDSGLSNKEIAEAIFVSEGTLKWHLHNVYSKLNVRTRSGAMVRARALGIL